MNHQNAIRNKIINTAYLSGKGCHIGSSLSIVDILVALFEIRRKDDEVILSKGHAALAWYATLNEYGLLSDEKLATFEKNGSPLTVLAVKNESLLFECSTGSLGQGISVSVGMAIAMKKKRIPGRIYVIVGDGECNEGVVWEAAQLAAHHKLNNLCVLVDYNKFQSDGNSKGILRIDHPESIWEAFGFCSKVVNGHDTNEIINTLREELSNDKPTAIICRTTKGYGVSFMENSADWHYNRLTNERYMAAIAELGEKYAR